MKELSEKGKGDKKSPEEGSGHQQILSEDMDGMGVMEGEMEMLMMMMKEMAEMVHQLHQAHQDEGDITRRQSIHIYVVQGHPGPQGYARRDGQDEQVNPLLVINVPAAPPHVVNTPQALPPVINMQPPPPVVNLSAEGQGINTTFDTTNLEHSFDELGR